MMTGSRDCWEASHWGGGASESSLARLRATRVVPHLTWSSTCGSTSTPLWTSPCSKFSIWISTNHQLGTTLSPLQLNLICTQTVDQPQRKLYFQPISILVPSFLSQYPPIRSCLRMSLLPDVSPGAKPLVQHPPTFLSFSQSLDSIISTAGTLVVVTSVIQLSTQSPSHPVQSFAQKPINLYLYISTYSHVICIGILAFLLQNIKNNKQCEYYWRGYKQCKAV